MHKLKELIERKEAVSPVIGVILMVAITVILAAVIAAFVFGLGDQVEVGPQTSISASGVEIDGHNVVKLDHRGGDRLTLDNTSTRITVDGTPIDGFNVTNNEFTVGDTLYLFANNTDDVYLGTLDAANADAEDNIGDGTVSVRISDVPTQQLIASADIRFN